MLEIVVGELVLELVGVWKGFDRGSQRVPVLEDVSLTVAAGRRSSRWSARAIRARRRS